KICTKFIDPYRAAPRPIVIVIVRIVLIDVHIVTIAITIERIASFVDGACLYLLLQAHPRSRHWFALFHPARAG
ncbi:MAG: hypothetical protein AAB953_00775, partial [Patescibacteria group bacterium]